MSLRIRTLSILLAGSALVGAAPPLVAQEGRGQEAEHDATEVGKDTSDENDAAIVVTGTRIRGARVPGGCWRLLAAAPT